MTLIDGFVPPGQIMQIFPNSASSAAQILMQSAFSCALIGDSLVSGVLHTIHTPLSSIEGKRTQIASLYICLSAKPCTTESRLGQGNENRGLTGQTPFSYSKKGCLTRQTPNSLRLEDILQGELHDPRILGRGHLTEEPAVECRDGIFHAEAVCNVEGL